MAQLDSASVFGTEGWGFESLRAYFSFRRMQRDAICAIAKRTAPALAARSGFASARYSPALHGPVIPVAHTGKESRIVPHNNSGANVRPLCLDQFMKLSAIAGSGGQAKVMIQSGEVKVNGKVETRRRRKLVPEDVVEVNGDSFRVKDVISTE